MKSSTFLLIPLLYVLPAFAVPVIVYDNTPAVLPPNIASLGFQATGVAEFGDLVQFAPSWTRLSSATVVLSNWAYASEWGAGGPGYLVPLTFSIYNVDSSSGTPQPGSVIASVTQSTLVPWRPEPSGGCAGNGWLAGDSNCYSGFAFTVQFDFNGPELPGQIIYGLSFDTQTYGANPYGSAGPYDELNFGVMTGGSPSAGSRPLPDTAYVSSTNAFLYTDGGAGGTGFLRQDTNWTPYSAAVSFSATPEPGTAGLFLGAAILIGIGRLRTRKRN